MKKYLLRFYNWLYEWKCTIINDMVLAKIKKPTVHDSTKAIQLIVDKGYSMCRFGDGEFSLIRGEDLKFQNCHKKLAEELYRILKYPDEAKECLICIPDIFEDNRKYTSVARNYWKRYLHYNINKIYKLLRFDKEYYNSLITRFYIDYENRDDAVIKVNQLKSIWRDKKILIIEGEKSRLGMGNDLFAGALQIKRLVCPAINAYDVIDDIENKVSEIDDYDLILIALGPTATVLAYRLYLKGYQALDIGHVDIEYEWCLKGAEKKEPVQNKYIGEIPGGDIVADCVDEEYQKQVVGRIGL